MFVPLTNTITNIVQNLAMNGKSVDGVVGIQTRDSWMVGTGKYTEPWRPRA